MHFFLYEIAARVVGAYLCYDCVCTLRDGLADRKIAFFNSSIIDSFFIDFSKWIVYRDKTPIQYWFQICTQVGLALSCFVVTIFGWIQPSP